MDYSGPAVVEVKQVDESDLLDLALGLCDDPVLCEMVQESPALQGRLRSVKREVEGLENELRALTQQAAHETPALKKGKWHVLLAVDGSGHSRRATATAAALAIASRGTVTVLHVSEVDLPARGCVRVYSRQEAEGLVSELVDDLRLQGVHAYGAFAAGPRGLAGRVIAEAARSTGCDLVVISARRRNAFFDGLTRRTLRHVQCPVLVVK